MVTFGEMCVSVTLWSAGVRCDLLVPGPEEMSRDELIVVVRRQVG